MTTKGLIKALEDYPPETKVRFVEYQDGKTVRRHLTIGCNTEHQAEIGELWLTRSQYHLPETD